jgi:hypothetical protein
MYQSRAHQIIHFQKEILPDTYLGNVHPDVYSVPQYEAKEQHIEAYQEVEQQITVGFLVVGVKDLCKNCEFGSVSCMK